MRVFIDSAEIEQVRTAHELGLVDGLTSNPSLVSATDREYEDIIEELDDWADKESPALGSTE
jgi:transaldolase